MAVDPSGRIHVTGSTLSPDFPVVGGTGNPETGLLQDAFLAHLAPDGELTYSSYGTEAARSDYAHDLVLGSSGEDFIAGYVSNDFTDADLFLARGVEVFLEEVGPEYRVAISLARAPDGTLWAAGFTCSATCEGLLLSWREGEVRKTSLGAVRPAAVAVDPAGRFAIPFTLPASCSAPMPSWRASIPPAPS